MGCNLAGWAVRAKNVPCLTYLFRKGFNPNFSVDNHKNSALHHAARYGNLSIVDTVLNAHDEILILEAENDSGKTAAMIAAEIGQFHVTKKMLRCGCSARRALSGKYWAWLLAFVRQRERCEVNTQTGYYGDDDEKYFPTAPDPNYVIWGWK